MPSYDRELDLVQGYNFKKDVQKPIGFITSLKIAGVDIPADQTVSTPMTKIAAATVGAGTETAGTLKVVSVLKKITWNLGDTDPIEFTGTMSVTGKQLLMAMLYATLIDTSIEVSWAIYEYDPLQKKYYVAFSNSGQGAADATAGGKGVPALIKKESGELKLTISPTPAEEVQSPENYEFTLNIVPWPVATSLMLASASMRKVTKPWGRVGPVA